MNKIKFKVILVGDESIKTYNSSSTQVKNEIRETIAENVEVFNIWEGEFEVEEEE